MVKWILDVKLQIKAFNDQREWCPDLIAVCESQNSNYINMDYSLFGSHKSYKLTQSFDINKFRCSASSSGLLIL